MKVSSSLDGVCPHSHTPRSTIVSLFPNFLKRTYQIEMLPSNYQSLPSIPLSHRDGLEGVILLFDDKKGFGFIKPSCGKTQQDNVHFRFEAMSEGLKKRMKSSIVGEGERISDMIFVFKKLLLLFFSQNPPQPCRSPRNATTPAAANGGRRVCGCGVRKQHPTALAKTPSLTPPGRSPHPSQYVLALPSSRLLLIDRQWGRSSGGLCSTFGRERGLGS